ncbi:MAG: hypothetical protein JWR75_1587 [Devosia sp.]|nr:hypothetical protein [Devosia sp.]
MRAVSSQPASSQFSETLIDILDRVHYRRVDLHDALDPVYRLRYEAYRREEFIPINSQQVAGDLFDEAPNAMCYGIYVDDQLVSSIRLHHVTPTMRQSPSRSIYPEELDALLDSGRSYIDPSRFTADREATLALPALPFLTLRVAVMASIHFDVDYCLSSVRLEHAAFYKRVFMSRQLGGERYYPGLHFPVVMFVADVPQIRERVFRRYPFFMSTPEEREAVFGRGPAVPMVKPSARVAMQMEEPQRLSA